MRITVDRRLCTGSLSFCERCFGIFVTTPQGVNRACVTEMRDDGFELLTLRLISAEGEDTLTLAPADAHDCVQSSGARWLAAVRPIRA